MNTPSGALARIHRAREGGPNHHVSVDAATLRPLSCTRPSGQRGQLCWAVIDLAATDLVPLAYQRWQQACGDMDIRAAAPVIAQTRKRAASARQLQSAAKAAQASPTNRMLAPLDCSPPR